MDVLVRRSSRRRKTIQARLVNGVLEIAAPVDISDKDLEIHISRLKGRVVYGVH